MLPQVPKGVNLVISYLDTEILRFVMKIARKSLKKHVNNIPSSGELGDASHIGNNNKNH